MSTGEQGVLAKNKDLVKAFGTDKQLEVCRIILDKGEMQVRSAQGRRGEGGTAWDACKSATRSDEARAHGRRKQPLFYWERNFVVVHSRSVPNTRQPLAREECSFIFLPSAHHPMYL